MKDLSQAAEIIVKTDECLLSVILKYNRSKHIVLFLIYKNEIEMTSMHTDLRVGNYFIE